MIMQYVTALPAFNPHGGPITHSSSGSKPDSPVHPLFLKLFLVRGLVCNSRTTILVIYSGIGHNTYSHCFEPHFTPCSRHQAIACPLETSHVTSLPCSRYFRKFQFESYFSPRSLMIFYRISNHAEFHSSGIPILYSSVSTMEFPKEGRQLPHDAWM